MYVEQRCGRVRRIRPFPLKRKSMYVEEDEQGGLNIMGISTDTVGSLIEAICMHINECRRQGITPDPELVRMKIEIEREIVG